MSDTVEMDTVPLSGLKAYIPDPNLDGGLAESGSWSGGNYLRRYMRTLQWVEDQSRTTAIGITCRVLTACVCSVGGLETVQDSNKD